MAGLSLRQLNLSSSRVPKHSISQRLALRQFEQWQAAANPYAPGLQKIKKASCKAQSFFGSGDASAAEPHAREAEDAARTLLGSQHPQTLSCMLALGNIVLAQGMLEEHCLAVLFVCILLWLFLKSARTISSVLGRTGMNIVTRIMGLLMLAVGVEYMARGLGEVFPGLLNASTVGG